MSTVVNIDPEILGGTPVFRGTRVPIEIFFDLIDDNCTINYFLEQYPSVKREQVAQLLEESKHFLIKQLASA